MNGYPKINGEPRDEKEKLKDRWNRLDNIRQTILTRCEEYARWTIPSIFPHGDDTHSIEFQNAADPVGAKATNHLANKIISILYPAQRNFFRLSLTEEAKMEIRATVGAATGDKAAVQAVEASYTELETQLAAVERRAMEYVDFVQYRPQAIHAAKLLIVTGNCLSFHPRGKPAQIYSLRDYVLQRDLSGEIIELITRECKNYETFHPDVQARLTGSQNKEGKKYKRGTNVTIYTQVKLMDDGKYHVKQCADMVDLDIPNAFFSRDKLPWIPLTWDLIRGEDYGRGLVEQYAGAFHSINCYTQALRNIAVTVGNIQMFVDPQSNIDLETLNQAPPGTWHSGKKDDISTPDLNLYNQVAVLQSMIERYEKVLAQAFLVNTDLIRDAERVTQEEIRLVANELETSQGGVYSRLASTWQARLAAIVLDQIDFNEIGNGIVPKILTGMDSISRAGELDNLRLYMSDLAMLDGIPEEFRAVIDPQRYSEYVATHRQVEHNKFLKTPQQIQQEQEMKQQQMQQQLQAEAQAKATGEAGAQMMREE